MKKSKFLALSLVVAVMLMGAGYALWSQDMVLDETVNTGDLKMEFVNYDAGKLVDYAVDDEVYGDQTDANTTTSALTVDMASSTSPAAITTSYTSDSGNVTVDNVKIHHETNIAAGLKAYVANMYPGGYAHVTARVKNTGTISTRFERIRLAGFNATEDCVTTNLKYAIYYRDADGKEIARKTNVTHAEFTTPGGIALDYNLSGADSPIDTQADDQIKPSNEIANASVGDGDERQIEVKVEVLSTANESNFSETQTLTFVVVPYFEQYYKQ